MRDLEATSIHAATVTIQLAVDSESDNTTKLCIAKEISVSRGKEASSKGKNIHCLWAHIAFTLRKIGKRCVLTIKVLKIVHIM